jgi:hypothetical protein
VGWSQRLSHRCRCACVRVRLRGRVFARAHVLV